ncbi:C25 family cysteine peptidase [Candidatus Omnitrophota bacterium]
MMKKIVIVGMAIVFICTLLSVVSFARTKVSLRRNIFAFTESLPEVSSQEMLSPENEKFLLYSFDGNQALLEEGKPQLPVKHVRVAIPQDAQRISVKVIRVTEEREKLQHHVYPAPKPRMKREGQVSFIEDEFYLDKPFYSTYKGFYPQTKAVIREMGNVRGQRFVDVQIHGLQYNPDEKELILNKEMQIEVNYFTEKEKASVDVGKVFNGITKNMLNVVETTEEISKLRTTGIVSFLEAADLADPAIQADYLIIAASEFYDNSNLEDFALHKANLKGFNVAVVKVDDIYPAVPDVIPFDPQLSDSGEDPDLKIKTLIKYAYDYWNSGSGALTYVLLVGDGFPNGATYYVPMHETIFGATTGDQISTLMVSDYWYSCLNDDTANGVIDDYDTIGDVLIGRLSVQTDYQLNSVLSKIVNYELAPPMYPDQTWGSRALLTSGFGEGDIGSHMPEVRDSSIVPAGKEVNEVDVRYCASYSQARQAMKDFVNEVGHSLWAHNGHGWAGGWQIGYAPSAFRVGDVSQLSNGDMLPIVFSMSCATGEFDHPDYQCLGERFVSDANKGAIAFVGAARVVGGSGNNELIEGIMDALFTGEDYILGSFILQGKLAVGYEWKHRHHYHLFGDPSLDLTSVLSGYEIEKPELTCSLVNFASRDSSLRITAEIKNNGFADADLTFFQLYDEFPYGDGQAVSHKPRSISSVPVGSKQEIAFTVPMRPEWQSGDPVYFHLGVDLGDYLLENGIDELCEANNISERMLFIAEPIPTNLISTGKMPAIYGNKLAWQDGPLYGQTDIYVYDLGRDGTFATVDDAGKFQLTDDDYTQGNVALHQNIIVWRDERMGGSLWVYDIGADGVIDTADDIGPFMITENLFDLQDLAQPSVYGNKIVYHAYRSSNWDVYMYDLDAGEETKLTDDISEQKEPVIYGDRIVWQDYRNGNWDIYAYEISTGAETRITDDSAHQKYPDISGSKIVWEDHRVNDNETFHYKDIYLFDLNNSMAGEIRITTDPNDQVEPAISGSAVVWEDTRNYTIEDIYFYNITSGTENQLTANFQQDFFPDVAIGKGGQSFVYEKWNNIYITQIRRASIDMRSIGF